MSCVAPAPNLYGLSHYFPRKIYRSAEVKKNFAQDLAEWHASVKLWIESVNEQVDIWNKQVTDEFAEKEAKLLLMPPIHSNYALSPLILAQIFASSISSEGRKELHDSIVNHLHSMHNSTKMHIDQLHNICTYLLDKSLTKPTVGDVAPCTKAFDDIFSLEHSVSRIQNPREALVFLESIPPEDIGADVKTMGILNKLILEQCDKIDASEEDEEAENEN